MTHGKSIGAENPQVHKFALYGASFPAWTGLLRGQSDHRLYYGIEDHWPENRQGAVCSR